MKKTLIIITVALLVLLAGGGLFVWNMMQQPLYQPGMVSAGKNHSAPLTPPSQQNMDDHTWLVEPGIELHTFSDGQGETVLVVHGGPGSPFAEAPAGMHLLAEQYRFVYYDQRGCGESTRPIERFTSSNMYENMLALDNKLGLGAQIADIERIRQILAEDKLILVGHSFGGFLAALYAAEFPEHVQALVLVAPADILVMPSDSADLFESVKTLLPQEVQPEYEAFMQRYLDFNNIFQYSDAELAAMNEEFGKYYLIAADARGISMPEMKPAASGGWMVWGMYASMGQRHDYRQALAAVQAPLLVLHGSDDMQSEVASRQYADLLPDAQFQVIPDAGHFIFTDQPELFARVVGEFLSSIER